MWNRESRAIQAAIEDAISNIDFSGIDLSGIWTSNSQTGSAGGGICHAASVYVPAGACTADEATATDGHVADILDAAGDASMFLFSICMADFANPACGSLETADSLSAGASPALRAAVKRTSSIQEDSTAAAIPFRKDTTHIFRDKAEGGHLLEDAPANRALIRGAVSPDNLVKSWTTKQGAKMSQYKAMLPDGRQAWAEVRDGREITNGGVNDNPR